MTLNSEELLTRDHAQLDQLLDGLTRSLAQNDGTDIPGRLDWFWARLAMHIRAEHLHLFPQILAATENQPHQTSLRETIAKLRDDHDFFMKSLARAVKLARASGGHETPVEVRDLILTVRQRLAGHNELEEADVYGLAKTYLSGEQQQLLLEAMKRELENTPPRFT